ncbi:hypothetical protein Glove_374g56 [Diversispora epigaea]|uniref:Uncharacterized protein n=1 Tax=Diversispora epigaea TaxID=1348612 RepID=A0A397H5P4_9GLOM|nr:hypothetical protein Glove_374g56 [Diversispora epigaea]
MKDEKNALHWYSISAEGRNREIVKDRIILVIAIVSMKDEKNALHWYSISAEGRNILLPLCLLAIPSREEDDTLLETIYRSNMLNPVICQSFRSLRNPGVQQPPSLDVVKITRKYLMSRILDTCADVLHSAFGHMAPLNRFDLASSSDINKCSWHIVTYRL